MDECRGAGMATRDNLKALIGHYHWLRSLPDPTPLLTSPRGYAFALAALRNARGRVLDDLTAMLWTGRGILACHRGG